MHRLARSYSWAARCTDIWRWRRASDPCRFVHRFSLEVLLRNGTRQKPVVVAMCAQGQCSNFARFRQLQGTLMVTKFAALSMTVACRCLSRPCGLLWCSSRWCSCISLLMWRSNCLPPSMFVGPVSYRRNPVLRGLCSSALLHVGHAVAARVRARSTHRDVVSSRTTHLLTGGSFVRPLPRVVMFTCTLSHVFVSVVWAGHVSRQLHLV